MTRVLVAYCTDSGSTVEVAATVAEQFAGGGVPVDVRRIRDVGEIDEYGAVVVGGPVILGAWHPDAVDFVTRQQSILQHLPVAFFMTALHLTLTPAAQVRSVPTYVDTALGTPPQRPDRLSFTERYATAERYLAPVLEKAPLVRPRSVAFFAGKMEYRALTLPRRLFARLVIRKPGDFRNWLAIRAWAADVRHQLLAQPAIATGARQHDSASVVAHDR